MTLIINFIQPTIGYRRILNAKQKKRKTLAIKEILKMRNLSIANCFDVFNCVTQNPCDGRISNSTYRQSAFIEINFTDKVQSKAKRYSKTIISFSITTKK